MIIPVKVDTSMTAEPLPVGDGHTHLEEAGGGAGGESTWRKDNTRAQRHCNTDEMENPFPLVSIYR